MIRKLEVMFFSGAICLLAVTSALAISYNEAPMLRTMVAAGELPPVEERLPEQPLVFSAEWSDIPKEDFDFEIGQYGGVLRVVRNSVNWDADVWAIEREPLITAPGGMEATPETIRGNIVRDYEISEDGKVFTFYMRKGLRWSDGYPVTTEDVLFAYEDVLLNEKLTTIPAVLRSRGELGGPPMELEVIDDYTFQITFSKSYPGFAMRLALYWEDYRTLLKPKHYLKRFHTRYTPLEELEDLLIKEGFGKDEWDRLFLLKDITNWEKCGQNAVDFPILAPWVMKKVTPVITVYERNPYYWKVDAEGNQLPYIDGLRSEYVADPQTAAMKIISGELDLVDRSAGSQDYALFKENEEKGGYKVTMLAQHFTLPNISFNMTLDDPIWREITRDIRFREALNMAIPREDIIDIVFFGYAELPTVVPGAYDLERANQLLDEMGLDKRDAQGWRLQPDGKRLVVSIEWSPYSPDFLPSLELIVRDWQKVGLYTTMKEFARDLFMKRMGSNDYKVLARWENMESWWLFADAHGSPKTAGPRWWRWAETDGKEGEQGPDWYYRFIDLISEATIVSLEEVPSLIEEAQELLYDNVMFIVTVQKLGKPLISNEKLGNVPHSGLVLVPIYAAEQLFYRQ